MDVADNHIKQITFKAASQQYDILQIHSSTHECAHVKKNLSFTPNLHSYVFCPWIASFTMATKLPPRAE